MEDRIRSNGMYNFRKNLPLYLMLLPFMTLFFTFTILPVTMALITSFTHYDVIQPMRFIGLENFRRLFLEDDLFVLSIQNTFMLAVMIGPAGFMLSFIMAWLINELPTKVRAILTIIFYAPSMAGGAAMLFTIMFSSDRFGWANNWLLSNNLIENPRLWFEDPVTMIPLVVLVNLWSSLGLGFLGFVAGLQTVEKSQYEAAYVDGMSNRWQELWFITLPNMRPQLMFGAVLAITGALSISTAALTGFPSPQYATHTMTDHLTDFGQVRMEMGYASAIAILMLAIMLTCNMLFQKFLRRVGT